MKIVSVVAENIKKLRVVQVTPDGSVVQITGPNGSGKSSLMDAIFWALKGERAIQDVPVRHGEEKARIRLDLGEIVVTRRFTAAGGTSLVVEAQNGARFPSPQRLLDDLLGELTFDPLAFTRMDAKAQAETLRALVGLDVAELERQSAQAYGARTDVNRQVKSLTERIAAIDTEIDPKATVELIDVSALLEQMQTASKAAADIERERARRAAEDAELAQAESDIEEIDRRIARLQEQRGLHYQKRSDLKNAIVARSPIPRGPDTADLRRQVEDAQRINREREKQAHIRATRERIANELTAAKAQSDILTAEIEHAQRAKRERIAGAQFPVPGLSLDEEGAVVYNGVPFEQASSAEQLRVSVALAMAANPKLRILRVKDGSLLDEKSLALIAEMVTANDYQLWLERVDTSGKVGIVLENGVVVAIDGQPVQPEPENEPAVAG